MRIRTIKPEFWRHEVMAQLPAETQLLGLALLNMADDEGYFEANPRIVRGEVMPFRDDLATISRDIRELSRVGWIEVRETVGHGQVGLIVNWGKHQRVDHPKDSKLSVYFNASDSREYGATTSREPRDASREEQGTGNREVEQGSPHPLQAVWNETAGASGCPKWGETPKHRRKAADAALARRPLEQWRAVFVAIAADPFATGKDPASKGWRADVDYALRPGGTKPEPALKYLERASAPPAPAAVVPKEHRPTRRLE